MSLLFSESSRGSPQTKSQVLSVVCASCVISDLITASLPQACCSSPTALFQPYWPPRGSFSMPDRLPPQACAFVLPQPVFSPPSGLRLHVASSEKPSLTTLAGKTSPSGPKFLSAAGILPDGSLPPLPNRQGRDSFSFCSLLCPDNPEWCLGT